MLSQKDDDGLQHPVAYFSKKLLPCGEKYSAIEKECLTIKLANAFQVYLIGKLFVIETGHHALK